MNKLTFQALAPRVAAAVALALAAGGASAADLYLKAHRTTVTVPVSAIATTTIPMWTYSRCEADYTTGCVSLFDGGGTGGPIVTVPNEPLTIHLRNELDEPTSVYIPGLPKPLSPVRQAGRITSFDTATAPGATGVYTWQNPRPGTFLLQSGTHPQKQVQMGLHGALRVGFQVLPAGESTRIERSFVFSEIDPVLHGDGTSAGTFAANAAPAIRPVPQAQAPQGYAPRYFLVNGRTYSPGSVLDSSLGTTLPGDGVLIDLVNAGLESHAPQMLGGEFEITSEDGYTVPGRQWHNSTLLGAGKALQVFFKPQREATYTLLDRRLRLSSGSLSDSGMLARMTVGAGGGDNGGVLPGNGHWEDPTAVDDFFSINEGGSIIVPPGVLANDTSNSNDGFQAIGLSAERDTSVNPRYGTVTLNANGGFTYTPTNPKAFSVASLVGLPATCTNAVLGRDNFKYFAVHTAIKPGNTAPLRSTVANVDIELKQVNDAPTTVSPDFYWATTNTGTLSIAATGFLANDIAADVDCDTLLRAAELTPVLSAGGPYMNSAKTASLITFGTNLDGTGTGAFNATANARTAVGVSRFTYRAADLGGLKGTVGTVYAARDAVIDVDLVNDTNSATYYLRTTGATNNRWTIRMAGRPITVSGVPKTYKLTFYAVFNGVTTKIAGPVLNTLQGTATSRTFAYSAPMFTAPGGGSLPEHSQIGLRVDVEVPADGIIPAHIITLTSNIPVL